MTVKTQGRGRPRPIETIERDQMILSLIRDAGGSMTRNQLSEQTGLSFSLVWLSLSRLRNDGKVDRCIVKGTQFWCVSSEVIAHA